VAEQCGEIFNDLRDPPAEERRLRALRGIETAILDNDRPRMAREVARLECAGFEARDALVHAVRLCNGRLEDGMTHAYGHCAIYTLKAGQLIERLGEEIAEPVLLALTRMLVQCEARGTPARVPRL
jgi:hypothetical protein